MIIDVLKNASLYVGPAKRGAAALAHLQTTDFRGLQPGRYDIDGDNLYVLVQHYTTRPEDGAEFESHRNYADVHYVVEGAERMGYAHIARLEVTQPYDAAKDCEMLRGQGDFVGLPAGTFAIMYPDDAHMPCLAVKDSAPVNKVVVKLRVG